MAGFYQFVDTNSQQEQLPVLRGILLRIAQAENAEKFSLIKQVACNVSLTSKKRQSTLWSKAERVFPD